MAVLMALKAFLSMLIFLAEATEGTEIVFVSLGTVKSLSHTVSCDGCELRSVPRGYFLINGNFVNSEIEEEFGLKTSFSVTEDNVTVAVVVTGLPLSDRLWIGVEIFCCDTYTTPIAKNWEIFILGITSVEDVNLSNDAGVRVLSWSPPSFFSKDILQKEKPVYNILVNGASIVNTTNTSVSLNNLSVISNCSPTILIDIITSVGNYRSSKNETFRNNVCITNLINKTKIYDLTEGKFSTNIIFQYLCSIKVCSATCLISIDYGNGTISNDSFQVLPSNKKSVTVSQIINGLRPGSYTIEIACNSIKDILNFTIIVPNNDSIIHINSSLPHSFISATISSVREGLDGIRSTSSNIVDTSPVTSSPPLPDGGSASTKIAIALVISILFIFIIMIICYLHYINRKKKEVAAIEDDDTSQEHINIFDVIKQCPVVMQDRAQDESTTISDERSLLQEPNIIESSGVLYHNYNGLSLDTSYCTTEQTLSFVDQEKSAIVTNHQVSP